VSKKTTPFSLLFSAAANIPVKNINERIKSLTILIPDYVLNKEDMESPCPL
jgi:hypothetical protein